MSNSDPTDQYNAQLLERSMEECEEAISELEERCQSGLRQAARLRAALADRRAYRAAMAKREQDRAENTIWRRASRFIGREPVPITTPSV